MFAHCMCGHTLHDHDYSMFHHCLAQGCNCQGFREGVE